MAVGASRFPLSPSSKWTAGSVALALLLSASPAPVSRAESPDSPVAAPERVDSRREGQVGRGLLLNLAGDFDAADAVWQALRAEHPDGPAGPFYSAQTGLWRQLIDPTDTALDAPILGALDAAERRSRARLERDPDDVEALLFLGGSLTSRARVDAARGHFYRAGVRGEQGRVVLERARALAPDSVEVLYPLGLYYYYSSLAPRFLRWFRWLWFVPTGDGPAGLRDLERVVADGGLYAPEAAYYLSNIYTYYEPHRLERGYELITQLSRRFPGNTYLRMERIEALFELGRYRAVEDEARRLEAGPVRHDFDAGQMRAARVWRARALLHTGRPDDAWAALEGLEGSEVDSPPWLGAWVELVRGRILDIRGDRAGAVAHYERVRERRWPRASRRAAALAREGLERPFALPVAAAPPAPRGGG